LRTGGDRVKRLILLKPAEPAEKLIFKRAALCGWLQRTMRLKYCVPT
jgi:hypothetical protein